MTVKSVPVIMCNGPRATTDDPLGLTTGCPAHEFFASAMGATETTAREAATRAGWTVGRSRTGRDMCPRCTKEDA